MAENVYFFRSCTFGIINSRINLFNTFLLTVYLIRTPFGGGGIEVISTGNRVSPRSDLLVYHDHILEIIITRRKNSDTS